MGDLIHLPVALVVRDLPPKEALSNRQIYQRGKRAIRLLNESCPSGVVMHSLSYRERREIKRKFVVKHGYRTTMYSVEVPPRFITKTVFCCPGPLADVRAADRLRRPWSWLWRRYRKKLRLAMFEDPEVLVNPVVCISNEKRSYSLDNR